MGKTLKTTDSVHGVNLEEPVPTKQDWQHKLKEVQLRTNYPQNFGKQSGIPEPLLAHSPAKLGRFRVLSVMGTAAAVGIVLYCLPQTGRKGRPHIFSSGRTHLNKRAEVIIGDVPNMHSHHDHKYTKHQPAEMHSHTNL